MTISYNADVASSTPLSFLRILKRWKGSVWKSVAFELTLWTCCFLTITFVYRYVMNRKQQRAFELLAMYFQHGADEIPLAFILGFFVNVIIQRWTDAFKNMGYLENQAIHISSMILGDDEHARMLRRTMARYLCLAQVLVFRDISVQVRKRFPTHESIVKAGFMLEAEKAKIEGCNLNYDKYWVPINWAFALVIKARQEGLIFAENYAIKITDEIRNFRNNLQTLCNYDWIEIPLAYPQAVFLSVHTYFVVCLIGRQHFIPHDASHSLTNFLMCIPIMTMLQYLFYVGWMKVAEGLLNPFGEDDDDFECNFLIDKNFSTAMYIVDEAYHDVAPLQKDRFWLMGEVEPMYSKDAATLPVNPLIGSAARAASYSVDEPEPEMVAREPYKYPKEFSHMKRSVTSVKRFKISPFGRTLRHFSDRIGRGRRSAAGADDIAGFRLENSHDVPVRKNARQNVESSNKNL